MGSNYMKYVADKSVVAKKPSYLNDNSRNERNNNVNIFSKAWNLMNNMYDGAPKVSKKKSIPSRVGSKVVVSNANSSVDQDKKSISTKKSAGQLKKSKPKSVSPKQDPLTEIVSLKETVSSFERKKSAGAVNSLKENNSSVGFNSILEHPPTVPGSTSTSHRTDVNISTKPAKGQSRSCSRPSGNSKKAKEKQQYIRLSEIFQNRVRLENEDAAADVLSREFLESINQQIREIKGSNEPSKGKSSSQLPAEQKSNVNINVTVSLGQIQGADGAIVEFGKPSTVRINVPKLAVSKCSLRANDSPPTYPLAWKSRNITSLENTVVTQVLLQPQKFSEISIQAAADPVIVEVKDPVEVQNHEEQSYHEENSSWKSYLSFSNAFSFTGESIKMVYNVAEDIVSNFINPPNPHIQTVEELNAGEDKIAISIMRLVGIPQQARHSIYKEALQELNVIQDVSAGTINVLTNFVNFLCTGDMSTKEAIMEKTRILATMQSEVECDSEVWQQFESDIFMFANAVGKVVKGGFAGSQGTKDITQEQLLAVGGSSNNAEEEQGLRAELSASNLENAYSQDQSYTFTDEVDYTQSELNSMAQNNEQIIYAKPSVDLAFQAGLDVYVPPKDDFGCRTRQKQFVDASSSDQDLLHNCDDEAGAMDETDESNEADNNFEQDIFYEADDAMFQNGSSNLMMADENSHCLQATFRSQVKSLACSSENALGIPSSQHRVSSIHIGGAGVDSKNILHEQNNNISQQSCTALKSNTYLSPLASLPKEPKPPLKSALSTPKSITKLAVNHSGLFPAIINTSETKILKEKRDTNEDGRKQATSPTSDERAQYHIAVKNKPVVDLNGNEEVEYQLVRENAQMNIRKTESWLQTAKTESKLQTELLELEDIAKVLFQNVNSKGATSTTCTYFVDDAAARDGNTLIADKRSKIPTLQKTPVKNTSVKPEKKLEPTSTPCNYVLEEKKEVAAAPNKNPKKEKRITFSATEDKETRDPILHRSGSKGSQLLLGYKKSSTNYLLNELSTITLYPVSPPRTPSEFIHLPLGYKGNSQRKSDVHMKKKSFRSSKLQSKGRASSATNDTTGYLQPLKAHPFPLLDFDGKRPLKVNKSSHSSCNLQKRQQQRKSKKGRPQTCPSSDTEGEERTIVNRRSITFSDAEGNGSRRLRESPTYTTPLNIQQSSAVGGSSGYRPLQKSYRDLLQPRKTPVSSSKSAPQQKKTSTKRR